MNQLFDTNLRYTAFGLQVCRDVAESVRHQIEALCRQGYNYRTVIGPASTPSVNAADFDCDPKEFHALWVGEVMDYCLDKLLAMETR